MIHDYDADGDGFPAAGFGFGFIGAVDCDDINAAVNPDATETFTMGLIPIVMKGQILIQW